MNKSSKFHDFGVVKPSIIPREMLGQIRTTRAPKINKIADFSMYNRPLEVCMGMGCNKKPTYMYYSPGYSNIMACEEHKRGPMHKISETRCHSYCEYKPVYFEKTDPTKKPKYCECHVETLISGGFSKKGIIDFMGLASNPPLTLDEYEVLF